MTSKLRRKTSAFTLGALRVVGVIALLLGAQIYAAHRYLDVPMAAARGHLVELLEENTHLSLLSRIHEGFEALARAAESESASVEVLRIQQDFTGSFPGSPPEAAASALDALSRLRAPSPQATAVAQRLAGDLQRLRSAYTDHSLEVVRRLNRPPWYLWPAVVLWRQDPAFGLALRLNRALYLGQAGDLETARALLESGPETGDPGLRALARYALGRLHYEGYRRGQGAQSYREAIRYTQLSLEADPGFSLGKRFLEYLLSSSEAQAVVQGQEGDQQQSPQDAGQQPGQQREQGAF